jgi:hypothetical protein
MRAKDHCPHCNKPGEPTETGPVRDPPFAIRPVAWKCSICGIEWDINEDFECIICGVEVHGRYLCCSEKCSEQFNKL